MNPPDRIRKMRRMVERTGEPLHVESWRRHLAGMSPAHRAVHERGTLVCLVCPPPVGAVSPTGHPVWTSDPRFEPAVLDEPPADAPHFRRADGKIDAGWMRPHHDFVMGLPLQHATKLALLDHFDQVAVSAHDDAVAGNDAAAGLSELLRCPIPDRLDP